MTRIPSSSGAGRSTSRTRVTARVDASAGVGGLSLRYDERFHVDLEVGGGSVTGRAVIGGLRQEWTRPFEGGVLDLHIVSGPPEGDGGFPPHQRHHPAGGHHRRRTGRAGRGRRPVPVVGDDRVVHRPRHRRLRRERHVRGGPLRGRRARRMTRIATRAGGAAGRHRPRRHGDPAPDLDRRDRPAGLAAGVGRAACRETSPPRSRAGTRCSWGGRSPRSNPARLRTVEVRATAESGDTTPWSEPLAVTAAFLGGGRVDRRADRPRRPGARSAALPRAHERSNSTRRCAAPPSSGRPSARPSPSSTALRSRTTCSHRDGPATATASCTRPSM